MEFIYQGSLDQGNLLSTSIFSLTLQITSHDGIYAEHTKQVNYGLIIREVDDWGKGLAVCSEKHNLLPFDVLPAEDNFFHCFLFSDVILDYQQMFLFYEKTSKLLHSYTEGRGNNHLQSTRKNTFPIICQRKTSTLSCPVQKLVE